MKKKSTRLERGEAKGYRSNRLEGSTLGRGPGQRTGKKGRECWGKKKVVAEIKEKKKLSNGEKKRAVYIFKRELFKRDPRGKDRRGKIQPEEPSPSPSLRKRKKELAGRGGKAKKILEKDNHYKREGEARSGKPNRD